MRSPDVELPWWEGCPSTERAHEELREALREVGLTDVDVRMRETRTDEEAGAAEFRGSPTIPIDGADLAGAGGEGGEPIGLSCRVYRHRDGRISPIPDPDDLRDTLRR